MRRATAEDIPALLDLLHRYFTESNVHPTESAATLLPQVQSSAFGFYVAEARNGLAGCVLGRVLDGKAHAVECKRLYVEPRFRSQGLATSLMDEIETAARAAGLAWVYLDSKDDFAAAIKMYRRRGYSECPRFNDNPQATVFFRKCLL